MLVAVPQQAPPTLLATPWLLILSRGKVLGFKLKEGFLLFIFHLFFSFLGLKHSGILVSFVHYHYNDVVESLMKSFARAKQKAEKLPFLEKMGKLPERQEQF